MTEALIEKSELTRACAASEQSLLVSSVVESSDLYEPDSVVWKYDRSGGVSQWEDRKVAAHVERIISSADSHDYVVMSSEGEVIFDVFSSGAIERMTGAGTWIDGAKGHGRMLALARIEDTLYSSGNGGQTYVRSQPNQWRILTNDPLFDPDAHARLSKAAPPTDDPRFLQWLMESRSKRPRNISFHDINGLSHDAIYLCGVEGIKPVLCFWDGSALHELKVHLEEAALTGIHIEHADSVWVCGREGVLLHGSYARGFTPVNLRQQLNLFHMITPYRGKLILPSSVRPGGLFELAPGTSDLRRFSPALPKLRGEYIFYAGAVGDVLWVVGQKDIFRFDGNEWERIEHPDL